MIHSHLYLQPQCTYFLIIFISIPIKTLLFIDFSRWYFIEDMIFYLVNHISIITYQSYLSIRSIEIINSLSKTVISTFLLKKKLLKSTHYAHLHMNISLNNLHILIVIVVCYILNLMNTCDAQELTMQTVK